MKSRAPTGPSATEIKLRGELDRVRRELTRLKKANVAGAASAALADAAEASEAAESAEAVESSASLPAGEAADSLQQRVEELESIRERLSRLYFAQLDENRRRSSELYQVLKAVGHINSDLDIDSLLQRVVTAIQNTLGFRAVVIRLREPGTNLLKAAAFAGISPTAMATMAAEDVLADDFESWLREEFRISQSFFISHKHPFNRMLPNGIVLDLGAREEWEWHAEDVLLLPLRNAQGDLVGYFSVDDPVDRLIPSRGSVELLEHLAAHALVAIDNARIYRDLTERSRKLEAVNQRSNEINVLKSNFVSTVSHELLTPLTTIRAFLDALRAGGADAEKIPHYIDVINEETQRLSRLIVSILDLSRFDSGNQTQLRRAVDLGELLGESAQVLKPMAEAGQVNLKVANELADTRLDADRDQLRQLLLHLGSNAIKFTPAGGSVLLQVTGDERVVRLRVEDTGIGIPAEALDKVFDRFYQVDSSLVRRYGGVGLGLALCKSIVEWHGGRVMATSEPGQGSCFTVELPRRGTARVLSRDGGSAAGVDLVKLAVEMVAEVMNAGVVSMMTVQPGEELAIQAAIGLDPRVVRNARVRLGEGVSGWVAQQRRPVCVSRPEDSVEVQASGRPSYSTGTFLSVPLEGSDGRLIGVLNVTEPTSGRSFQLEDCRLALDLAERVARAWERSKSLEDDRMGVENAADALRQVIEHLRRGQRNAPDRVRLAATIARELRLDETEVGVIAFAAAVHDVGMTLVGDNILGGAFNDEKRLAMQRHVELGVELLHRIETMGAVREVVLSHHEWWDGSGYPQGLREADIPIGARVLAVVDAFESMTQGRTHRDARSREAARDEVARLKGRQFDPDVVEAFERVLPGFEIPQPAAAHDGRSAMSDAGR